MALGETLLNQWVVAKLLVYCFTIHIKTEDALVAKHVPGYKSELCNKKQELLLSSARVQQRRGLGERCKGRMRHPSGDRRFGLCTVSGP